MTSCAPDVVTLGETMGLFYSPVGQPISTHPLFRVSFGGAESNVAIGLSRLGTSVEWVGRLGGDDIGRLIERDLRAEGVLVYPRTGADSTGIMVRTRGGHGQSFIHYSRTGSAGSALRPDDLDFDAIATAKLLHVTGITLALGPEPRAAVFAAVRAAKEAGVDVSFDVNHRTKLWSAEESEGVLETLIADADIVFATDSEAQLVLGGHSDSGEEAGPLDNLAKGLAAMGPREVVIKQGEKGSMLLDHGSFYRQNVVTADTVDAVGAGDAFAAGYIHALLAAVPPQDRIDFAGRVAAHAVTMQGDWEGLPRKAELEASEEDVLR